MKNKLLFSLLLVFVGNSFAVTNSAICPDRTDQGSVQVFFCVTPSPPAVPYDVCVYRAVPVPSQCATGGLGAECLDHSCTGPSPQPPDVVPPVVVPATLPFLAGAVSAAVAVAAALLAGVAVLVGAPVLVPAGAISLALMAAVAAMPGFGTASNAQSALNAGPSSIAVNLVPALVSPALPLAGDTAPPSVVVAPNGLFVPGGGGLFTGNGASGGWSGGATGEWQYTPPVTVQNPNPLPTATIGSSGAVLARSSSSALAGGLPAQVQTISKSVDGTVVVTNSSHVPVTTPAGVTTTLDTSVVKTFLPSGAPSTAVPSVYVAPKFGDGTASSKGAGSIVLAPGSGSGSATGGESTSGGNTCGGPGQPKCQMEGGGSCGGPSQPACKIDETGTPNGQGVITSVGINAEFDKQDAALEAIKGTQGKDTSWGVVPHWLASSGGCSPAEIMQFPSKMNLPPLTLDICPQLPLIYTLMNLLWVTATFGVVISMVLRVTT